MLDVQQDKLCVQDVGCWQDFGGAAELLTVFIYFCVLCLFTFLGVDVFQYPAYVWVLVSVCACACAVMVCTCESAGSA